AIGPEGDDRISDQLSGPVERDAPAAVDHVELGPVAPKLGLGVQEVLGPPQSPGRVDGGMLHDEQRVGDLLSEPRPGEVVHPPVRVSVGEGTQREDDPSLAGAPDAPGGPRWKVGRGQAPRGDSPTSGPKSHVSRFCLSRPRNCAAVAPSMIRWSHDMDRYTMC